MAEHFDIRRAVLDLIRKKKEEDQREAYRLRYGRKRKGRLNWQEKCPPEELVAMPDEERMRKAIPRGELDVVKRVVARNRNIVNAILQRNKSTGLHLAVKAKYEEITEILLTNGANVHARNKRGRTPLHMLSHHKGENAIVFVMNRGCEEIARMLAKYGSEIDARDELGRTAMHLSVITNNVDAVAVLLQLGSDLSIRDNDDKTAVEYAIAMNQDCLNMMLYEHSFRVLNINQYLSVKIRLPPVHMRSISIRINESNLYEIELTRMKETWLDDQATLFDFITKRPIEMQDYLGSYRLKRILSDPHLDETYSMFAFAIRVQISRCRLVQARWNARSLLNSIGIPDVCSEKIVGYLDARNLQGFYQKSFR